jgi:hypothetical protein
MEMKGHERPVLHSSQAAHLFWAPLLGGFVIAWPFAFAVNRTMIRRGKGHAVVRQDHGH